MSSFNRITIVGYLGRSPEIRYLPDGTPICSFSMATTEKRKSGGEAVDETTWFKVNVWGKQGETASQYLFKGSQAYVEGSLSNREYTDKDGNKRTTLEVRASDVKFLDRKPEGGNPEPRKSSFTTDQDGRVKSPPIEDDSEIPF